MAQELPLGFALIKRSQLIGDPFQSFTERAVIMSDPTLIALPECFGGVRGASLFGIRVVTGSPVLRGFIESRLSSIV